MPTLNSLLRTNSKGLAETTDVNVAVEALRVPAKRSHLDDTLEIARTGERKRDVSAKTSERAAVRTTDGVDLPDPALYHDELDPSGKPRFETVRFSGPLFVNAPTPHDVRQGQLSDCFVPSAMAAIAQCQPKAITHMVKENTDGSYTFAFHKRFGFTGAFQKETVKVDGDLYVNKTGAPLYGSSAGVVSPAHMELWFPLFEKAYAAWKGSYEKIGNGGNAGDVFEAVLGAEASYMSVAKGSEDRVWKTIENAVAADKPASMGTGNNEALYKNTGIFGDHSYSVLGCKEEGGKRYVQLRNPWGDSEPKGNGANDGVFYLEIAEVCRLYDSLEYVR